ncbi:MAG: hypothetical protein PWQ07_924 [Kosmotoga sp.]|nr:hypothetical protein [Kosmotoga sp.]
MLVIFPMRKTKKGNSTIFITVILIFALVAVVSAGILRIGSEILRLRQGFVDIAIKRITLESAKELLDFSKTYQTPLNLTLNEYELKSYFKDGEWWVEIQWDDTVEILREYP